MNSCLVEPTNPSLLRRIRFMPADQTAWAEFVRRYGQQIHHWCLALNLQPADPQDVTQCVLLKLLDRLRDFDYDPGRSFRAYVKTLTRYTLCDFLSARARTPGAGSGDTSVLHLLQNVTARDD